LLLAELTISREKQRIQLQMFAQTGKAGTAFQERTNLMNIFLGTKTIKKS
jgi:hypothetical protein